jgi:hypothetical protein
MSKRLSNDPATTAVMEWFEDGNTGTEYNISEELHIPVEMASLIVKRLNRFGIVKRVGRVVISPKGKRCAIWGECEVIIKHKPVNVSEVITNQPEIVRIWNRVVA